MRFWWAIFFLGYMFSVKEANGQLLFHQLDSSFTGEKIILPPSMSYQILFKEGEIVTNIQGKKAPTRGNQDFNHYIPVNGSNEHGFLYISHETNDTSTILGDGGGGSILEIRKADNTWFSCGNAKSIDFSTVGGTFQNCSGFYTTANTILSAEEFPPFSNKELYRGGAGFRDTSDFNGLPRWQNMGWMVEVDPFSRKALRKLYKMGRFSHEAALVMPDSVTVYLTDDFGPAVFFKFIASKPNQFEDGQLYAYKQSLDGESGDWIGLPMVMDSLINIRNVALRMGATIFTRLEWMTQVKGKLYITETGMDDFTVDQQNGFQGQLAAHLHQYKTGDHKYDYPFGAVLQFDPANNSIKQYIKGGPGILDKAKHFSNPDAIKNCVINGKDYLVINEDLIALTKNRVNNQSEKCQNFINEIWWLDMSIPNPTTDNLYRFLIAPLGAETTGGTFTPDFKTYFVNIQHPRRDNPAPFNRSLTIAITGIEKECLKKKCKRDDKHPH